jgi:hypothetical protein
MIAAWACRMLHGIFFLPCRVTGGAALEPGDAERGNGGSL